MWIEDLGGPRWDRINLRFGWIWVIHPPDPTIDYRAHYKSFFGSCSFHLYSQSEAARTAKVLKSSGGSRISGKGVHMYRGVGIRFADFRSFFLNIP